MVQIGDIIRFRTELGQLKTGAISQIEQHGGEVVVFVRVDSVVNKYLLPTLTSAS